MSNSKNRELTELISGEIPFSVGECDLLSVFKLHYDDTIQLETESPLGRVQVRVDYLIHQRGELDGVPYDYHICVTRIRVPWLEQDVYTHIRFGPKAKKGTLRLFLSTAKPVEEVPAE